MKMFVWILIFVALLLILWVLGSWYVVHNIEEPDYTLVRTTDTYEIRQYAPMIIAQTRVDTSGWRDGMNSGFMVVADYIFGNNESTEKIAMTAPVITQRAQDRDQGEKIAMTTPVLIGGAGTTERTTAFVMPREYTLETLPRPRSDRVQLEEVPARTMAVKRFSWWAGEERVAQQTTALLSALGSDGVEVVGEPYYAGYNPPMSVPFLRRHEVMIEVKL